MYWACATPPGGRQAEWLKLGPVGVMEARRRRDDFVARVRRGEVGTVSRRAKVREVAELYLAECEQLVDVGALAPSTLDSYRLGLRRHFLPTYGNRDELPAERIRAGRGTDVLVLIARLRDGAFS